MEFLNLQSQKKSLNKQLGLIRNLSLCIVLCLLSTLGQAQSSFEQTKLQFKNYDSEMGTGLCTCDFNNDGWEDVFAGSTEGQSRFFINNKGHLELLIPEESYNEKEKEVTGVELKYNNASSAVCGDIDNDGDQDLILASFKTQPSILILENIGNFKFKEVRLESKFDSREKLNPSTVLLIDVNHDGLLDLYILNYRIRWGTKKDAGGQDIEYQVAGGPNMMYINQGNMTFNDQALKYGLMDSGSGLGVMSSDINGDHFHDILLLNDFGKNAVPNKAFIWNNNNKKFNENLKTEFKISMFGMGVASGDLNGDGTLDYYMTNIGDNHALFSGENVYRDLTKEFGIENGRFDKDLLVSWGTNFIDIENDGREELFVAHGNLGVLKSYKNDIYQRNSLFKFNPETNIFDDIAPELGFTSGDNSRASIQFDYNYDGKMDLMISNISWAFSDYSKGEYIPDSPLLIQTNTSKNDNHFLSIRLKAEKDETCNNDAFGSTVILYSNKKKQMRDHSGGGSYHAKNSNFLHFGIGETTVVDSIAIYFPGQKIPKKIYNIPTDHHFVYEKGDESLSVIEINDEKIISPRVIQYARTKNDQFEILSLETPFQRNKLDQSITIRSVNGAMALHSNQANAVSVSIFNINGQLLESISIPPKGLTFVKRNYRTNDLIIIKYMNNGQFISQKFLIN